MGVNHEPELATEMSGDDRLKRAWIAKMRRSGDISGGSGKALGISRSLVGGAQLCGQFACFSDTWGKVWKGQEDDWELPRVNLTMPTWVSEFRAPGIASLPSPVEPFLAPMGPGQRNAPVKPLGLSMSWPLPAPPAPSHPSLQLYLT